jgi:DNA-binding transcriptional LysR family regulator
MDQSEIDTLTADDRKALAKLASVSPPKPELAFVTFARAAGKDLATDYRHADLRGYVLRGQDLSAVNLEGADLRGADLHGAVGYRQRGTLLDNSANSPTQIPEILEVIAKYVPTSPTEAPVEFVRDLGRRWKEGGGLIAGKPRHSHRYLDDLLRARGTPIKSLVPKLVGRTNLRPADADVLVRLFLSHWDYIGDPDSGAISQGPAYSYEPLLSDPEIARVSGYVAQRIMAVGVEARSKVESATAPILPGTIDTFRDPSAISGIVRLGVSEGIVHTWLPTLMKRVNDAHPNLEFEIEVDISPKLSDRLVTGDLNLAFLLGPNDAPSVHSSPLCSFPVAFVAHKEIKFPRKSIALEHLAERRIITFEPHARYHIALRELFASNGIHATIWASASLEVVVQMALDGLGIAVIPPAIIEKKVDAREKLRRLNTNIELPSLDYVVSWPTAPDKTDDTTVRKVVAIAMIAIEVAREWQMATGEGAPVAALRDANLRSAPQDEVDG